MTEPRRNFLRLLLVLAPAVALLWLAIPSSPPATSSVEVTGVEDVPVAEEIGGAFPPPRYRLGRSSWGDAGSMDGEESEDATSMPTERPPWSGLDIAIVE